MSEERDWIGELFDDQLGRWREYLLALIEDQIDWPSMTEKHHWKIMVEEASSTYEMFQISEQLHERLGPPRDPRKQLEERFKTWDI